MRYLVMLSLRKHVRAAILGATCLLLLAGCARYFSGPASQYALLTSLSDELQFQYHECVPLGWQPVPVANTYYPGFSASAPTYAEFLDAIWRGRISTKDLRRSDARTVSAVLTHLVLAGLLSSEKTPNGVNYFLRPQAFPYYFGSSVYKNNRDSLQYLCYSRIVPDKIVWSQPILAPPVSRHASKVQWYRVVFTWKPSTPAAWASDPFLRAHSIVLSPTSSPTAARMYYNNDGWHVAGIYDHTWMLPKLARDTANRF